MLPKEKLYTEKELIQFINDEFGENALNRPMLAYMRDIRHLIPKPIRTHLSPNRHGGAYSHYTEDTLNLLKLIFTEKIKAGKNLKEIEVEHHDVIEQAVFNTEAYKENIKKSEDDIANTMKRAYESVKPFFEAMNKLKDNVPSIIKNAYIDQLEKTLKAFKDNNDKEIDEALNSLSVMTQHLQKWRLKRRIATQKNESKD